jgi:hypothetical protein
MGYFHKRDIVENRAARFHLALRNTWQYFIMTPTCNNFNAPPNNADLIADMVRTALLSDIMDAKNGRETLHPPHSPAVAFQKLAVFVATLAIFWFAGRLLGLN